MMRKLDVVGLTLFVVSIFSAFVASPAFAEGPSWLVGGVDVLTLTSVETEGELLLEDSKVALLGGAKFDVLCSGLFEGSVGPEGEDEITMVVNLSGTLVELGVFGMVCTNEENCETPLVYPENLPWNTQLELMSIAGQETLDHLLKLEGKQPGWTLECNTIIGKITDECSGLTSAVSENMASEGDVLEIFDTTNTLSEKTECARGTATSGEIVGELLVTALEGLTMAVSGP